MLLNRSRFLSDFRKTVFANTVQKEERAVAAKSLLDMLQGCI